MLDCLLQHYAAPLFLQPGLCCAGLRLIHAVLYCLCAVQVQNMLLSILCGSSVIILLLGVMTRFVMEAQQARLMWCVAQAVPGLEGQSMFNMPFCEHWQWQ